MEMSRPASIISNALSGIFHTSVVLHVHLFPIHICCCEVNQVQILYCGNYLFYLVLSLRRWATHWSAGVRFSAGTRIFSIPYNFQIGSGDHSTSCPADTDGYCRGVKRADREANHTPPSSAEVKNNGAIPPLHNTSSWRDAYLIKHRDNFTLPLLCSLTKLQQNMQDLRFS
jgi:hypothetical protein